MRTPATSLLRASARAASRQATYVPRAAASTHAISNPQLANIEKRWEGMPPTEQAELWMALRDRMKTNWSELTVNEKKAGTFVFPLGKITCRQIQLARDFWKPHCSSRERHWSRTAISELHSGVLNESHDPSILYLLVNICRGLTNISKFPTAYWIAFGAHGPRAAAAADEGQKVIMYTVLGLLASFGIFAAMRAFAGPAPSTMNKEYQEATNEYLKVSNLPTLLSSCPRAAVFPPSSSSSSSKYPLTTSKHHHHTEPTQRAPHWSLVRRLQGHRHGPVRPQALKRVLSSSSSCLVPMYHVNTSAVVDIIVNIGCCPPVLSPPPPPLGSLSPSSSSPLSLEIICMGEKELLHA